MAGNSLNQSELKHNVPGFDSRNWVPKIREKRGKEKRENIRKGTEGIDISIRL